MLYALLLVETAFAVGTADCSSTYVTPDILEAAVSAEHSFARLDAQGFAASRQALEQRVACTTDRLDPATFARVHLVEALGAFLDGRQERVPLALAGMFAAEPGHQVPAALLAEGHPVRQRIGQASSLLRDDPGVAMPKPKTGWIEVDGAFTERAPTQRGAVVQQVDSQDEI